jgi:hypothetical protein
MTLLEIFFECKVSWKARLSFTIEFGCTLQTQPSDNIDGSRWENAVGNIVTEARFLGTRVSSDLGQ